MWRFYAFLKYICVLLLAGVVAFASYRFLLAERDRSIYGSLAKNGIELEELVYKKDSLVLYLDSAGSSIMPDDIMLIRKTMNALREIGFKQTVYYIKLRNTEGKIIFSDVFYNIYSKPDSSETAFVSPSVDEVMVKFSIKYALNKYGVNVTLLNFYDTIGEIRQALYMEMTAPEDKLPEAVRGTITALTELNLSGAGIYRYSFTVYNSEKEPMCVVSRDITYGDIIYWKSPAYSFVKTMFDTQ